MFNYKSYKKGLYDRNQIWRRQQYFRNLNVDENEDSGSIKNIKRRFYKSRKRKMKKRKTVRFSEDLEEKHIINDMQKIEVNRFDDQNNNWDITIDFEELV